MPLTQEVKDVAKRIGLYYLEKNKDNYDATEEEINNLKISKIEVTHAEITITAVRVGLLIGKKGLNIDALAKFLGVKIKIVEDPDPLSSYLIPYKEEDSYDPWMFELEREND